MRIDAHTHIWRAVTAPQAATIVSGQCDVTVELLRAYLDEHQIDRAVLVQPVYPGTDNSYVANSAAADSGRLASVCVVDPRRPDAADQLRYWVTERGCRGLRLRPRVADEAAAFGHAATWPLWEAARELGAVVSVLAGPEHLPTIGTLAERFAPVNIVLDHFAHPRLAEPAPEIAGLLALARLQNVHIKTSGHYYFSDEPYPYHDCRRLVTAVFDAFGPDRLLWGSDFPHVLLKSGYARSLRLVGSAPKGQIATAAHDAAKSDASVDLFCGRLSAADRDKILGRNAARLYWPAER